LSSDGVRLAAAAWEGSIYVSADSGQNWLKANAPTQQWQTVASSADGIKLAAGIYDRSSGGIYTAIAPPALMLRASGNAVILSWPDSATGFTLQQNPDLSQASWTDVGAGSLVNGVNQVSVSPVTGRRFFRLIHR
jgi:hypothetical protein